MNKLFTLSFLLVSILSGYSRSETLTWDPNPELNLASYRIYYGTGSRAYINSILVPKNITTITISNLSNSITYYFAVTAINDIGLESDFSNELVIQGIAPPKNLKVIQTLQSSKNLKDWMDVEAKTNLVAKTEEQQFFRVKQQIVLE